jgi:CHASE2 domain-containing sensor protein
MTTQTTNATTTQTISFWAAWALLTVGMTYRINEMFGPVVAIPASILIGTGSFALLTAAWVLLPIQTKKAINEWNKAKVAYAMSQAVK